MNRLAIILVGIAAAMLAGVALAMSLTGSPEKPARPAIPSHAVQTLLIEDSMRAFTDSVARKDMTGFHAHISELWRSQASVADLNATFGPLISSNIDLRFVNGMKPEIAKAPIVTESGVLELVGTYPSNPVELTFEHSYVLEDSGWKMSGIRIGDGT